jgi:hypothetical protein
MPEPIRSSPVTRPEHSEAYWQTIKCIILGLAGLMILALILAVIILFRMMLWS